MMFGGKETRTAGLLYPRESETREVKSLDGIWDFVRSNDTTPTAGIREKWFADDLSKVRQFTLFPKIRMCRLLLLFRWILA